MRARAGLASLLLAAALLGGCGGDAEADEETIELAKQAHRDGKARGVDIAREPCLGVIKEGWVANVADGPRQGVDDDPENQCEAYRSGEADHFVELDPEGEFIRSGCAVRARVCLPGRRESIPRSAPHRDPDEDPPWPSAEGGAVTHSLLRSLAERLDRRPVASLDHSLQEVIALFNR